MILLHAAETGACVHGHGPKPKCPESHFRTAPHAFDPIRPFTSHRPSDRLHAASPPYHDITTSTRNPVSPVCHLSGPSQQPLHGLRQPTTVAFVITSVDHFRRPRLNPELLRPNAQPASTSNIAAASSTLRPVAGLTARVHDL